MPTRQRAVIYVRISSDPEGERAGVQRQRAECLAYAEAEGLAVVEVIEDNDRSAYSGKARPGFERVVDLARSGSYDVLVAWSADRIYRLVRDLSRITDELAPHVRIATVKGGPVDLTTAEGILRAQVMGSVGEFESRRKGERVAARAQQRAESGVMTASRRPFGWQWADPDPADPTRPRRGSRAGLVPDEQEAEAVRAVMQLVADGGSVRAAARWLRESGHVGTTGRPFTPETTRSVLTNPRHAGLVAHRGRIVGESATGERLVSVELWQQAQVRLSDPSRRTSPGRPAGTVLSGIARCGRCGGPMNASNRHERSGRVVPVYVCSREANLRRHRDLVDEPVLDLVGAWLAREAETIRRHAAPVQTAGALRAETEAAELRSRLDDLAALAALPAEAGGLAPADYAAAVAAVRARLADAEQRAAAVATRPATGALVTAGGGAAEAVSAAWEALREQARAGEPEPIRRVLREVLAADGGVIVNPAATRGHPTPDDLTVRWAEWLTGVGETAA
jgi:site-specific DNA recombinase